MADASAGDGKTGWTPNPVEPGLWIVATPIGNLGDITLRAIDVLCRADAVLCEDTRVTGRLLAMHGIATKMIAYHDHNAAKVRPGLLARLARGATLALVSDAGTPLVSDPGLKIVQDARNAGVTVRTAPGASALLAGLAVAGLATDRFLFAGFLPPKSAARKRALADLAGVPATLVIYESAKRLGAMLADAAGVLGPRPAAVARELTKLHEEVLRDDLAVLAAQFAERGAPRGEIVVLIEGAREDAAALSDAEIDSRLETALKSGSVRDAADLVAGATGLPRRKVYARALALSGRD